MIYQVKDNKKIPLGTQFDNSEDPVDVTLTVTTTDTDAFTTSSYNGKVTLYPIGNDVYIFAFPVSGVNFITTTTGGVINAHFTYSISGYDILDLKVDYYQNGTYILYKAGITSENQLLTKYDTIVQDVIKSGQFIFSRGQGIVRRRK